MLIEDSCISVSKTPPSVLFLESKQEPLRRVMVYRSPQPPGRVRATRREAQLSDVNIWLAVYQITTSVAGGGCG
jgi:hypothetical protein